MYAIIETGGKQYWVEPGEVLKVEKLLAEAGAEVTFKALWTKGEAEGSRGGTVTAQVLGDFRERKILVFKKRSKKAYKKLKGHRQDKTRIRIQSINLN